MLSLVCQRHVWVIRKDLIGAQLLYDEWFWRQSVRYVLIAPEKGQGEGRGKSLERSKGDAKVVLMTEEGTLKEKER